MSNNIFMKVFWSLVALFVLLGLGVIIYALLNKLKIYSLLYVICFAGSIVFAFCMSLFINLNMMTNEIGLHGIDQREKLIALLEREKYSIVESKDNMILFKLNSFPQYIYNDISVVIEIDEDNNMMKIKGPSYFVNKLNKF